MRRVHSVVLALTMLVSVLVVGTATSVGAAPVLPAQFTDTLVAAVGQPTALAFLPDGRMLVTERPGRLRVIRKGVLEPMPVSGVPRVRTDGNGGLMDVALHPQFAINRLVYLTYTKPV